MRLVSEVMKSPVVTVKRGDKLMDLVNLSRRQGIRHLPVVEGDKLVGIISDRNLRENTHQLRLFSLLMEVAASLEKAVAETIMVREAVTTTPDTPLSEAARVMRERKIGCLPVVEHGKVVGIVTESDLISHVASSEDPAR
jgi:acetoin utilization protein AcuB